MTPTTAAGVVGFSGSRVRVAENNAGVTLTIQRTHAGGLSGLPAASVAYATSPGSATPGEDYTGRKHRCGMSFCR